MELRFVAEDIYVVLGGSGTVGVDWHHDRPVSAGVQVYDVTFG